MDKDFLSQDEVDALLKGVPGESAESAAADPAPRVKPYNLGAHPRLSSAPLAALELIHERFARHFRDGLFQLVRRPVEVTAVAARPLPFEEFMRGLAAPQYFNLVQAKPLRGTALFVFDPQLVSLFIDNLFGGGNKPRPHAEGRDYTLAERRVIGRMLEVALAGLEKAWAPVHPVKFALVRSEGDQRLVNVATPSDAAVVAGFNVQFGAAGGSVHCCLPAAMVESLRPLLGRNAGAEHAEEDKRWASVLSQRVQAAQVDLVAALGRASLTLNQVLAMQIGDVISIDISQPIVAEVEGTPFMECQVGVFKGQYALKVRQILPNAGRDR